MVAVLLIKFNSQDLDHLINWNNDTFVLRQSLGLIAVRGYKDSDSPDDYYSTSFWQSEVQLRDFIQHKDNQKLFKTEEIEWFKILKEDEKAAQGNMSALVNYSEN